MGERLLSDEGLAVLLLNIENGVAGLKWYRQSLLTLLSSSFCLVLDPGTPGAQHVGNFTAHGNPDLRSASTEKTSALGEYLVTTHRNSHHVISW